jgi:hypothetical protein
MKKDTLYGLLAIMLVIGFLFIGCDTGTNGGGNVTMILVNHHAETITKWEFYNKDNLSPNMQNVNIPSGESKTIPLTMSSPFAIEQIYITAGDQKYSGMVDFSPDDTTSTVTLKANGTIEDDT